MDYIFSHLNQNPNQKVIGPIQDDEALLLFALCKSMIIKKIVEVGTLNGYSTRNFIEAVGKDGHVISIDKRPFSAEYNNFTFVHKDINDVDSKEIPWIIDLVFFDSHDELAQLHFFNKMILSNKIDENTIIAVHDTNLHPDGLSIGIKTKDGWIHQPSERNFVNKLIDHGWNPFHVHTKIERHNDSLPFRHGLTLLSKKKYLK
jgi:predicted O-methyltransferase YrrM